MLSSPRNSNDQKRVAGEVYRAFFRMGMSEYYISNNSVGFASWPGRYTQAACELDKYLKDKSMGSTNDRIGFASWANSKEEFVFYLNHFFNLEFYTKEEE